MSSTLKIARVYQQQIGGGFTPAAIFSDVIHGTSAWGDYDNDGWLDVALAGDSTTGLLAQLWHNEPNGSTCTFSLVVANLSGVQHSTVAWGDYNGDFSVVSEQCHALTLHTGAPVRSDCAPG